MTNHETEPGYQQGLRDGRIKAIEAILHTVNLRLDNHATRISNLERVSYIVLGIVLFIQFAPSIKNWF